MQHGEHRGGDGGASRPEQRRRAARAGVGELRSAELRRGAAVLPSRRAGRHGGPTVAGLPRLLARATRPDRRGDALDQPRGRGRLEQLRAASGLGAAGMQPCPARSPGCRRCRRRDHCLPRPASRILADRRRRLARSRRPRRLTLLARRRRDRVRPCREALSQPARARGARARGFHASSCTPARCSASRARTARARAR